MAETSLQGAKALFIRRWGEMAASWGISRTMAEIHALLYLSTTPLCTDDVMESLQVSRGNASMNLRELVNWGLIQRVHRRGDRKEYFTAETDVWQMFETIMRERQRREVQPIIETIQRCRSTIEGDRKRLAARDREEADTCLKRLDAMAEFCEVMYSLFNMVTQKGQKRVKPMIDALMKVSA